jgi:SAM-dependent methyltransferase
MHLTKALRELKRWVAGGAVRAHRHAHYSDEELLARTDEFNLNAERHWKEVASEPEGRWHPLNKPVSTVEDTPDIFYRLGLVLDALDLGVGHTVLDFGAGSCWLSSILNRLRCRTVSLDVSQTALDLGRELFALDPRHRMDLAPRFLLYDGRCIPLPDASVDRVVCFDAYHHVPNGEEVLREIFRVLKNGGRAVFAEPGDEHSHTDHSALEVERCGILENDFHLDRFLGQAKTLGFEAAFVKPYPAPDLAVSDSVYFSFLAGRESAFPMSKARAQMRNFSVFGILKGTPLRDSRKPGAFTAEIVVPADRRTVRGPGGGSVSVPLHVTNTGDTLWLHEVDPVGGYVSVGAFLFNAGGELLSRGLARAPLPRDVAPGETADVALLLPLPKDLGRYVARLDVVSEWITWGAHHGSPTPEVELIVEGHADSSEPQQLLARMARLDDDGRVDLSARPGAPIEVPLRVTNDGDTRWKHHPAGGHGVVAVGGHLFDATEAVVNLDFLRVPLPRAVEPGATVDVVVGFHAPEAPGRYRLELDLVDEGIAWFGHRGSPTLSLGLLVD